MSEVINLFLFLFTLHCLIKSMANQVREQTIKTHKSLIGVIMFVESCKKVIPPF